MEPTEAAESAVWRVLERAEMDVAERQVVFDAVHAAFATVPEPLPADVRSDIERMVKVHHTEYSGWGKYPMGEIAARVDAFLRGES